MYSKDQMLKISSVENDDLVEEIVVIRTVTGHGEFSGNDYVGYIAQTTEGKLFSYNYPRANECYGETLWLPYLPEGDFEKLSDYEKKKFVENFFWKDITKPKMSIKELFDQADKELNK